jgi:GGDEF domain-containing protein
MPIRAGGDVLGVICVTDRQHDERFTDDDVAILRALAGPAALALGRERALVQAENFALTAAIDPVSGVFNRRHFHVRLEEELQRARRHQLSMAFLMIDMDNERIRERIEHYRPADPSLVGLRLTASIGLAVSLAGISGREFISRADHALYLAKRDGKNRVRIHQEDSSKDFVSHVPDDFSSGPGDGS